MWRLFDRRCLLDKRRLLESLRLLDRSFTEFLLFLIGQDRALGQTKFNRPGQKRET